MADRDRQNTKCLFASVKQCMTEGITHSEWSVVGKSGVLCLPAGVHVLLPVLLQQSQCLLAEAHH